MKTPTPKIAVAFILFFVGMPALAQFSRNVPPKPLDEALELYQEYSGKSVLRSPNLSGLAEFSKPIPSSDTNGMRVVLENELQKHGIEFVPLREVFVLAVEPGWKNSPVAEYISAIKPRPILAPISPSRIASSNQEPALESIPAGTIDFRGADLHQFLDLYAMLLNRTLLRSSQISSSTFKFRTQTPLTKMGAIYLLEVALALNGIASVEDGPNFMQIASLRQIANLRLEAPQPGPDEPLLDPAVVPEFRFNQSFVPGQVRPTSRQGAVSELVARYAELTGRTAVPTDKFGGIPILFKAQRRLTKPELIYALRTTLALNGLAIVQQDDKTIRVAYIDVTNKNKKLSQ